jgi:hypothetical protein
MPRNRNATKYQRRDFLQQVAATGAQVARPATSGISYPRLLTGSHLKMIAFPPDEIGTVTIDLGGRGQLRDGEIFNRPNKGNSLDYTFPAVWAQAEGGKPLTRVLEPQLPPPTMGVPGN